MSLAYRINRILRDNPISKHINYDNVAAPDTTTIVNTANLTNGAKTALINPDVPRNLVLTVVDTTPSIVAGIVTVVGKSISGKVITEVFNCAAGAGTYTGSKAFASITSITTSGFSVLGGSGNETLAIGVGSKLGLPASFLKEVVVAAVGGVNEAVGTVSLTNGTIIPTTAPDGTKDFDFWFTDYLVNVL